MAAVPSPDPPSNITTSSGLRVWDSREDKSVSSVSASFNTVMATVTFIDYISALFRFGKRRMMENHIRMVLTDARITLYDCGWSQRRISRELGIHRETVRRHIRLHTGTLSKPAIPTAGKPGRKSQCKPYRQHVEKKLEIGLSAQRIFQDLRYDYGFKGSYEWVTLIFFTLLQSNPGHPPGKIIILPPSLKIARTVKNSRSLSSIVVPSAHKPSYHKGGKV
jgi:hypothetical protein